MEELQTSLRCTLKLRMGSMPKLLVLLLVGTVILFGLMVEGACMLIGVFMVGVVTLTKETSIKKMPFLMFVILHHSIPIHSNPIRSNPTSFILLTLK